MLPLLIILGSYALSCASASEQLALFALDMDAMESHLSGVSEEPPRFKRQSTVSYQVNHYALRDQASYETQAGAAVAPQQGYEPNREARQLGLPQQNQQRAPADYLDYGGQQYSSGQDALQQQYFGSLAQYAAEQQAAGIAGQDPAQPAPPPTTLSPEVREQIRLQQEYKDRPILEQERLALGLRRPPGAPAGPLPAGPTAGAQRGFPINPVQFVSSSGQPLVSPNFPKYYQEDRGQPQFPQYDQVDATATDVQYYPARPLFTSAESSGKNTYTKRLVPKDFPTGKSLLDPTQSFSYTQLHLGDTSADRYLSNAKLNDLRQKLVPQPESHLTRLVAAPEQTQHYAQPAQRSTLKQRPQTKYDPSFVYDAAAYQIEASTPNSLGHFVSSTPKTHYVSQAQSHYYQVVPTGTPALVYTQSSGNNGIVRPNKAEVSTIKPHHQVIYTTQPHYAATTPDYQYYDSTPSPAVHYEPPQKHHHKAKPKLIAPDFVTATGEQQLRQLQRLQQQQQAQQLHQAQQAQNYENQGIEFDQDLYASLYSQPTKGFYANIKKSAVHTPTPSPSYANTVSKSGYYVSTAAPLNIRESTLGGQDDYNVYKNNELNDLSVNTPDGRKPLTPAEIKALISAGFHIPDLKQSQEVTSSLRQKPVYSYQPVAVPVRVHAIHSPTTEVPEHVTQAHSPTYSQPLFSTVSPYDDVSGTVDSSPRPTVQRYRTTPRLVARKRVTVTPAPSSEEEKLGLPKDGVRHYYRVDASDSGTAPQGYVLVGGPTHEQQEKSAESSRGLTRYSSLLVARSADEGKKTEKTR